MLSAPSAALPSQSPNHPLPLDSKGASRSAAVDSGLQRGEQAEISTSGRAGLSALRFRTVAQVPVGADARAFNAARFQRDLLAARLELHYEPTVKKALQEAHKWIDGRRPPESALPAHEVSAVLDLLVERDIQAGRPTSARSGFASSDAVLRASFDVLMQTPRPPHDSLAQWPGPPTDECGAGTGPSLAADISPDMFSSASASDESAAADITKQVTLHLRRQG
ncbi:MAG: hypothetical protein ACOVK6_12805 [Ramlibacter sp.]|jgi:hypothetical protein